MSGYGKPNPTYTTFINNIPASQDNNIISSTIISMAHHLGIKVLAEGVETREQLAFLREQGCDSYQGYLYSEALSVRDFEKMLATFAGTQSHH